MNSKPSYRRWAGPGVLAGLVLVFAMLSGCRREPAAPALNTLTADEQAEGWVLLFDGETFDGWRTFKADSIAAIWDIQDGAVHRRAAEGPGGDLISAQAYDNFELQLDWKIAECGNSGIMFRVSEEYNATYETGPEMQVLDNTCHPDAQNGMLRWAGSNYALHQPLNDTSKPAGEWNQVRLVVNGAHVEHWLNGEKVVEYELWSDDWKQRVAESKFVEMPGYGLNESGHIALQDHGDEVWYRNIKVRPLQPV